AEYESGLEADSVLVAIIDSAGVIADDVLVFSGFLQGVHGNRFEPREQGEAAALAGKPEEIVVHAHVDASLADPVDLERYQCLKQVPGVFLAASYIVVNKDDEFLAALSDLVYHFGDGPAAKGAFPEFLGGAECAPHIAASGGVYESDSPNVLRLGLEQIEARMRYFREISGLHVAV